MRSGVFVNNLQGEALYKSFKPSQLPPNPSLEMDDEFITKLVNANKALSSLNTASELLPNVDIFLSKYLIKEALISSQIEGTQCTLVDVFDADISNNVNLDVADVINYVNACNYSIERLKTLPLCCRLLKEIHEKLMAGVRGEDKNPGEFRRSQNWIGPANCSLKEARYIPPNVDDMIESMSSLEKYINESEDYDPLIQAALIHYQFETIHPFLDGNGRVGRLLILLYLMEKGLLNKPTIYISYFLKKNQIEYYDRISEVRRTGNYEQWVKFFLDAVAVAAQDSERTIRLLNNLHINNLNNLPVSNRAKDNVRLVFNYIENHPIIDIKKTASELGISFNTASTAIRKLVELEILYEQTNASRNRVYVYKDYLDIIKDGT